MLRVGAGWRAHRRRARIDAACSGRAAAACLYSRLELSYEKGLWASTGSIEMNREQTERYAIRELVENWAVWRDAGDWERFRGVWHPEGQMWATWFQGSFDDFIRVSREGFAKGVRILHFLGGSSIDLALGLAAPRAIAQTKMTISQRAMVHDVEVDVVCTGRFYDFIEKRNDEWRIVLRRLIYEKDRMDPVDPSRTLALDPALLAQFPIGYKHLAYLQASIGYDVKKDMAGLIGPQVDALYAKGKGWLEGKPAL